MKYFYRWSTIGLCILFGIIMLCFYFLGLSDMCRYPFCFPLIIFFLNVASLVIATWIIRKPGVSPQTKFRIHYIIMFVLLIINPSAVIAFSKVFISVLWALNIATFLLYCLLFVRFQKYNVLLAWIPFWTFLVHVPIIFLRNSVTFDLVISGVFAFFLSLFYFVFYLFFKWYLDNSSESLSVYLENKDVSEFIKNFNLTKREEEICFCIVNGYSAKITGEKLFISEGTVKNHTKKIYRKIGISGRMELMHLIWDFTLLR